MQSSKYLLANERDALWGLTISTVGYEVIDPGDVYPTKGHAEGYYFRVENGRTLNEYQLLYNMEGEGWFESAHCPKMRLQPGDMFLLFPGEWHSYQPDPATGWTCFWIGFKGKNIEDRLKAGFLSPKKPVYHVGYHAEIEVLYKNAYQAAIEEAAYSQQMLAGLVNHLIGLMYALERNIELNKNQSQVDMVNKARMRIRESVESDLTIQQIAANLGTSYSNFRRLFKEYTGFSPATYQQELRLLRAKELLTTTNMSIKEIAYRLNFESPDYFSTKFKAKMGIKPSDLRG